MFKAERNLNRSTMEEHGEAALGEVWDKAKDKENLQQNLRHQTEFGT